MVPFTSKSRTIVEQSLSFIVSHNTFFLKRRGKMNLFNIESATAKVKKILVYKHYESRVTLRANMIS